MRVYGIKTTLNRRRIRLDAQINVERDSRNFHIFFDYPLKYWLDINPRSGDPYLALTFLPAMALGETLQIEAPISFRLAENITHLQEVFLTMNPDWHRISVEAQIKHRRQPLFLSKRKRGLFFSLGVDSFYSLKELMGSDHPHSISHLIVVHGFDVYYQKRNHDLFQQVLEHVHQVADQFNLSILDVVTNIRDFTDHYVNWKTQYGCGTFSVGLALQSCFETIYLASGMSDFYDGFIPYGSGPLITPFWSTERMKYIQHGGGACRQDKINDISNFPAAMEHLRVCWENPGNVYNCGKCEKCLRTMVGLLISGGLSRCQTFPETIALPDLEKIHITNHTTIHIYQRLIDDLLSQEDSQDISRQMAAVLARKIAEFQRKE